MARIIQLGWGEEEEQTSENGHSIKPGEGKGGFIGWPSEKEGEWGPKTNYAFFTLLFTSSSAI